MSLRIAVVYEADADFRTGTELADRALVEAVDWLDPELVVHQREWIGDIEQEPLSWKSLPRLCKSARIRAHGHIDGNPLEIDAAAARRAILYLKSTLDDLDAVVLLRDQDDQPERRGGLEQARQEDHDGLVIVIGLAIVEREAWVISGFEPQPEEQEILDAERQVLGFYPHEKSHQLTACKNDSAPRSPKRVLHALTLGNYNRQRDCWMKTDLNTLRERGAENGLAAYLDEVRTRLAPLIGHVPDR